MDTHQKKTMKEQYKQRKPEMGVLVVKNRHTSRCFLDVSTDIPSMFNRIQFQLKMGMHRCKPLQSDWNQSGESAFLFEVIDTLPYRDDRTRVMYLEELQMLKHLWTEKLKEEGNCTLYQN